jgi:hypothetical protein
MIRASLTETNDQGGRIAVAAANRPEDTLRAYKKAIAAFAIDAECRAGAFPLALRELRLLVSSHERLGEGLQPVGDSQAIHYWNKQARNLPSPKRPRHDAWDRYHRHGASHRKIGAGVGLARGPAQDASSWGKRHQALCSWAMLALRSPLSSWRSMRLKNTRWPRIRLNAKSV